QPVVGIAGPDDVAGPDQRRALAEDLDDDVLARRLERAVMLADLLARLRAGRHLRARGVLALTSGPLVGVDRERGDEEVAADRRGEQLGRLAPDARHEADVVDDGVPAAAAQRLEMTVAIAVELLDVLEPLGVALAAVEEGQCVAAGARGLDDRRAEVAGAAE